jgi:hypothetical protein
VIRPLEYATKSHVGPFPRRWLNRRHVPLPDDPSDEIQVRAWILEHLGWDRAEQRRTAAAVTSAQRRALLMRKRYSP